MHAPDIGFENMLCFLSSFLTPKRYCISLSRCSLFSIQQVEPHLSWHLREIYVDPTLEMQLRFGARTNAYLCSQATPDAARCVCKLGGFETTEWQMLLGWHDVMGDLRSKNGWISWMWLVHFKDFPFQGEMFGFVYHWLVDFFRALQRYMVLHATLGSVFPAMSIMPLPGWKGAMVPFQPTSTLRSQSPKTPKGPKGLDTLHVSSHLFCWKDPTN